MFLIEDEIAAITAEGCALYDILCADRPDKPWMLSPAARQQLIVFLAQIPEIEETYRAQKATIEALTAERDHYQKSSLANKALAYQWMRVHDALLAFVQDDPTLLGRLLDHDPRPPFPKPADVPDAIERADKAEAEVEALTAERDAVLLSLHGVGVQRDAALWEVETLRNTLADIIACIPPKPSAEMEIVDELKIKCFDAARECVHRSRLTAAPETE